MLIRGEMMLFEMALMDLIVKALIAFMGDRILPGL